MATFYNHYFLDDWNIQTDKREGIENIILFYKQEKIIDDIYELIQLAELLKASVGNRLTKGKEYQIGNIEAEIINKDKNCYLSLTTSQYEIILLDKFESAYIAKIIDKIVNKIKLPTKITYEK